MYGLIFLALLIQPLFTHAAGPPPPSPDWKFVEKRLVKAGFKAKFINDLKVNYKSDDFNEVLELNTLLFLKKSDYHGVQVTPEATEAVRDFVASNQAALSGAEKKYGVPPEAVASLLWLESRQGKNKGTFHVPSVFLDLIQADRPPVVRHLYVAALRFTSHVSPKNRRDIASRTKKRVRWALAELKAIEKMRKRNPKVLQDFNGSFAGAFGMPQFEPSSYVFYARSPSPGRPPNLELAEDAIQSVAFYLHESGWRRGRKNSYVRALMRYNNSHDYAAAILKLAGLARPANEDGSRRKPATN